MTDTPLMQEPRRETRTVVPSRMTVKATKRLLALPAPLLELEAVAINGTSVTVGTDVFPYFEDDTRPARYLRLAEACRLDWYTTVAAACATTDPEVTITGLWGWRERYTTEGWRTVDTLITVGGIDTDDTTLTVVDADGLTVNGITPRFTVDDLIRIDDEIMRVQVITGGVTNTVVVLRAQQGTAAAVHAENTAIKTWTPLTPILSATQRTIIRAKTNDDCTPYIVSDARLQTYFAANGGSVPLTIVSVLEDQWAQVKAEAMSLTDGGGNQANAELSKIKALLDYWRIEAGKSAVSFTAI